MSHRNQSPITWEPYQRSGLVPEGRVAFFFCFFLLFFSFFFFLSFFSFFFFFVFLVFFFFFFLFFLFLPFFFYVSFIFSCISTMYSSLLTVGSSSSLPLCTSGREGEKMVGLVITLVKGYNICTGA